MHMPLPEPVMPKIHMCGELVLVGSTKIVLLVTLSWPR